jgi:hypothetical protein
MKMNKTKLTILVISEANKQAIPPPLISHSKNENWPNHSKPNATSAPTNPETLPVVKSNFLNKQNKM